MLGFLHNLFFNLFVGSSPNLRIERQSCCEAIGDTGNCAAISGNGQPLYTLCSSPRQHFFWDVVHPSDHGWKLVSKILFKKWNRSEVYGHIFMVPIFKIPIGIVSNMEMTIMSTKSNHFNKTNTKSFSNGIHNKNYFVNVLYDRNMERNRDDS